MRRAIAKRLATYRKFKRASVKDVRFNSSLNQDDLSGGFEFKYERPKARYNPDSRIIARTRGDIREAIKDRKLRENIFKDILTDVDYTIVDFNIMMGAVGIHEQPIKAPAKQVEILVTPEEVKRKLTGMVKNLKVINWQCFDCSYGCKNEEEAGIHQRVYKHNIRWVGE